MNFHLLRACNARCGYCFATFRASAERLRTLEALAVVRALRGAGAEKLNFVGGEPTLHPDLPVLIREAKALGFTVSVVSNGAMLGSLLESEEGAMLDWVGLSLDSGTDAGNAAVGRGGAGYVARTVAHALKARANGSRVKLNTVVTRVNLGEDLAGIVRRIRPERWKVFQVLRVIGQNDGAVEALLVTRDEFEGFVARHSHLSEEGLPLVAEDCDDLTDSYAMVDPLGRFFGNTRGIHQTGLSILDVGPWRALRSVGFEEARFLERGGLYAWATPPSSDHGEM